MARFCHHGGWLSSVVLAMLLMQQGGVRGKVELVDHGYEGIVIAINPYLKQDETLLKRLEQYLTDTSKTLFRATRNQLYFREFIIVIPETWKGLNHFENALDVQLDRAQIIIDQANPAYGDAPYVKQYAECGQPGLYIHLTPSYLLDDNVIHKWGRPDKTLVHEWAHLRWGLFDEYPIDAQDAEFYRLDGSWLPTRCTTEVDGSILNKFTSRKCSFDFFTGKPEKACRFFPRMKSNKAAASLMFMQYLESIVEFCDDPVTSPKNIRHNYLAPNRQNRLCAYRSAWEVMRKHEDFRNAKRPLPETTDTTPVFRYIQVQPRKRALVLDTSGSMTGSSLSVMMRAASNYILSCIETGSSLGIVQFNTNATALSPMIKINTEEDRQQLIKALPRQADGKTSIGAGLEKGLQLLNTMTDEQPGGSIILITDGKENERPFLTDFQQKLESKGVVVHSLAYGQRAEKSIAQLSRKTGGKTFFYSGRKDSTALIDGLAATVLTEGSNIKTNVPISVLTEAGTVYNGSPVSGIFIIDATVGTDTSVTLSHSKPVNITITSPKSVRMTRHSHPEKFKVDEQSGVIKIMFPEKIQTGTWTYDIETNESQSDVIVNVQSKPRNPNAEVLQISSWLSWLPENNTIPFDGKQKLTVFAELIRGRSPVLTADVTAIIERPMSVALRIPLHDNGIGSDIIKDDGVYSAYILASDLFGNGRYNIKIKAKGIDGATQVVVGGKGVSSGAVDFTNSEAREELQTERMDQFQRVTAAGEFRVTGFPESASEASALDQMAPARITDFHVFSFDPDTSETTLRWTAVGDDMDRGSAAKYVLQMTEDFDKILALDINDTAGINDEVQLVMGGLTPKLAGETELVTFTLNKLEENVTVFLSLRAVDENGNAGDISNIVTLSRARELAVPVEVIDDTQGKMFYLKLVLPPLAAVLLFVVFLVIVLRYRRSVKLVDDQDGNMSVTTMSSDLPPMNYRHDGLYRQRQRESPEMWIELGKSRESLDKWQ